MSSATAVMDPTRALDPSYPFRWIIAVTVTLASILEILDTSIVNVAIPHMMGSLGATLDQITWVSTGYIVANVIVLPVTGWMSAYFGRSRASRMSSTRSDPSGPRDGGCASVV